MTTDTNEKQNSGRNNVIAIIILVAFAALLVYMISQLGSDETFWTRALYLFGSVEAIAFAAAGYLFGREVSREQINKAEEQAEEAQQQAGEAQQQAATAETKAKDIVAVVKAQATGSEGSAQTYGFLGASQEQTQAAQLVLQQLSQTVEAIYNAR